MLRVGATSDWTWTSVTLLTMTVLLAIRVVAAIALPRTADNDAEEDGSASAWYPPALMRILYGVTGEGMGHATRSKVVCEHLVARGHEVKIVGQRARPCLPRPELPRRGRDQGAQHPVRGQRDGPRRLARARTSSPRRRCSTQNAAAYFEDVVHFAPDAVISDFDSFAWFFAKRHGLPVSRSTISRSSAAASTTTAIKAGIEGRLPDHQGLREGQAPRLRPLRHHDLLLPPDPQEVPDDTTLVPPILRDAILDAKQAGQLGAHVLVYQTSTSDKRLDPDARTRSRGSGSSSTASAQDAHRRKLPG